MSRRMTRFRSVRATRIAAGCLTASLTLYAASPLVTLWSVASALKNEDVGTLRTALDWRTVRIGLKSDFGASVGVGATVRMASATAPGQDELPDFGESFATTIVSHVVDDVVTPEHLVAMLTHPGSKTPAAGAGNSMLGRIQHIGFTGPCGFEASVRLADTRDAPPVTISMRIEKWQWKITRIHMPDQVATQVASRT